MKVFKNRVLAVLMAACMVLSLLPVSALAAEDGFDLTIDVDGTGVTWYAEDKEGTEISDEGFAVPSTEIEVDDEADVPTISLTTTVYVKADRGYALSDLEELVLDIEGDDEDENAEESNTLDIEITDEGLEYCDLKVTLKFDGYAVDGKSASIALTIDAEPTYELFLDVDGTGVTWYAEDKEGAEIGDEGLAIPETELEVNTDGEVPTVSLTTTVYVKANRGYALSDLEELVLDIEGDDEDENAEESNTLDVEITDEGLEYCDLKVTLKFEGYALEGTYADIALTIDAEPTYELFIDIDGTGVIWYAEDKEGAEIGDGYFAIPDTAIEVNAEGEVPTVSVNTTVYLKAARGYAFTDLEELALNFEGDDEKEDAEESNNFDIQITDEGLEYCDLKVTLKFEGYAVEGDYADISLTIDAEPTYLVITAGDEKLDIRTFSTVSYAEAEAIVCAVPYDANGATVAVSASVEDNKDGVMIDQVVEGNPAFDDEPHTGGAIFVDVGPENTIDNPVYVAVKYIPNKDVDAEAAPYDEYFKIALYMADKPVFTDIADDAYYYDAVLWAVENGITAGTGDGTTFSPDAACNRAQIVTFLHNCAEKPESEAAMKFTDVQADAYYADAVAWAVENSITAGTNKDGTRFSPYNPCTRAQAVTFLYRYMGSPAGSDSASKFTDVDADAYYADAVAWAVENSITAGTGDGTTFSPNATCTRAQIVTFLYNLADLA